MRLIRVVAACMVLTQLVSAADSEFKEIVQSISREFNTRPVHIPLFGLVNAFLFAARPAGTRHLDLAVFEDLDTRGSSRMDFQRIVESATAGRAPFVRVTSRRKGAEEQTLIYMRQEGGTCKLLLTTMEPKEATVIQMKLNPDAVQRWLKEPHRSAQSRGSIE